MAGHFPQKHRKKMESDWHLGIWVGRTSNSNEHILLTQEGVLRCRPVRRLEVAERYNKKIMENATGLPWGSETTQRSCRRRTIRTTRATTRNTWTVRRATGGPKTGSRTCTVPCVFWTNPRLSGMVGNKTRISPHGGLQSKTATVARPTGIRRNGNIRTGTIRTNARVKNHAGVPRTSFHRDSWR